MRSKRGFQMRKTLLVSLSVLAIAGCSARDLGRYSQQVSQPQTLPWDCMDRLYPGPLLTVWPQPALMADPATCEPTVPRDSVADHAWAAVRPNSPISRAQR
jgi:hypothetical protein